jgi:hypothetical protein
MQIATPYSMLVNKTNEANRQTGHKQAMSDYFLYGPRYLK